MIICVSKELKNLKEELISRGYTVIESNNVPCDVIICDLKNEGLANINTQNNLKREGTLIIDSGSKNIDEIEYILNNRTYSALF